MKFKIHDTVMINELNLPGRVRRVQLEESGILYEVRYFWNAEAKSVWFYEDEISARNDNFIKPHFEVKPIKKCNGPWHTMTQTEYMIHNKNQVYPRSCPLCGDFTKANY